MMRPAGKCKAGARFVVEETDVAIAVLARGLCPISRRNRCTQSERGRGQVGHVRWNRRCICRTSS